MGPDAMIFVFWILNFNPASSLSSFTFIKRLLVPLHFLPQGWCHLHIWGYWYFCQQSYVYIKSIYYSWQLYICIIMNQCKCYMNKDLCEIIIDHRRPDLEAFLMAHWVKNTPAMQESQEMRVRSLGWEDPLKEEMATHNTFQYSCLDNPMDRGAW